MSEEGRQAMRDAMRSGFERAQREHPEWFDGRTLTEQQQNDRRQYMQEGWNRAKAAVAQVSQVDAQQMGEAPSFMGGGPRPQPAAAASATAENNNGGNNGNVRTRNNNDGANTNGNATAGGDRTMRRNNRGNNNSNGR